MPTLNFTSSFKINSGLVLSPSDIRNLYLSGFEKFSSTLLDLDDSVIEFYIRDAQNQIENLLHVKLIKQEYVDNLHFNRDEWVHWSYMKTTYPVSCAKAIEGYFGDIKMADYPKEWMTVKKYGEEKLQHRAIYLTPVSGGVVATGSAIYAGLLPNNGYMTSSNIPYYWKVKYVTGFDRIPEDILSVIGKFTAIPLLLNMGDSVLGRPGITSGSISIDGLSQSMGSGLSGSSSAFGGRIKAYVDDLNTRLIPQLKDTYQGILFTSM